MALYQFIDREPQLSYLDQPAVPLPSQRRLDSVRHDLALAPEWFDGKVVMVESLNLELPEIEAFPASFAWRLAACDCPWLKKLTCGALTAAAWIEDDDGQLLWQRRSARVDEGMLWSVSVSGLVYPGLSPRRSIEETIAQEVGVDLEELTPLALVVFSGFSGIQVLYRGKAAGRQAQPNAEHVTDLLWASADDPPSDLRDSSLSLLEVWRAQP